MGKSCVNCEVLSQGSVHRMLMSSWWEGEGGWAWAVSSCEGASSLYGSYASWPPHSKEQHLQPAAPGFILYSAGELSFL